MKLKSLPDDFRVVELSSVEACGGSFALYELTKQSLGTPEAIQEILKAWNLPRWKISYGGMKDRHASTRQWLTIHQGPQKDLSGRSFSLHYLGQTEKAFEARDIQGNRFHLTLRAIGNSDRTVLEERLQLVQNIGLPNYFDDQRFGSLGHSRQFIAQPWCLGDYQQALFLAMAEPNSHDRPRESAQKAILRENWGNWNLCKERLDRSHRRSIVTYLVDHPTGFKRALSLVRSDLRSIYVAAFQSGLWNLWLSKILGKRFAPNISTIDSALGPLTLPKIDESLDESRSWLSSLNLPLPSARQQEWPGEWVDLLDEILKDLGMQRREIRLKYPRDTFFSKGLRAAWLQPSEFQYHWLEDELHSGKSALQMSFCLPRGSYATMIVKILQLTR
jgi:tRNA pseudouridine13 synthase